MTTINIVVTTPETHEHSINVLVHQISEMVKAKNPDNTFDAEIVKPVEKKAEESKRETPKDEADDDVKSTATDSDSEEEETTDSETADKILA